MPAGEARRVLVTGASSGIGLALCKQLSSAEFGCTVYLAARSRDKGVFALAQVRAIAACPENVHLVILDVNSQESLSTAAALIKSSLSEGETLYALVNNAGTGFAHNVSPAVIIETNLKGPKRVVDTFLPLLQPNGGRIVNVGSGAGPEYVSHLTSQEQVQFINAPPSWENIEALSQYHGSSHVEAYGLSKALLATYTLLLAKQHPSVLCSCLNPGFVQSNMTVGYGASLPPEKGIISMIHCLFSTIKQDENGSFYNWEGSITPLHINTDVRTYDNPLSEK